ncbi:Uncharacterised protein [Providencia heimbachae]|nr:Uncharacterised protein [Providencia heimbachae]
MPKNRDTVFTYSVAVLFMGKAYKILSSASCKAK